MRFRAGHPTQSPVRPTGTDTRAQESGAVPLPPDIRTGHIPPQPRWATTEEDVFAAEATPTTAGLPARLTPPADTAATATFDFGAATGPGGNASTPRCTVKEILFGYEADVSMPGAEAPVSVPLRIDKGRLLGEWVPSPDQSMQVEVDRRTQEVRVSRNGKHHVLPLCDASQRAAFEDFSMDIRDLDLKVQVQRVASDLDVPETNRQAVKGLEGLVEGPTGSTFSFLEHLETSGPLSPDAARAAPFAFALATVGDGPAEQRRGVLAANLTTLAQRQGADSMSGRVLRAGLERANGLTNDDEAVRVLTATLLSGRAALTSTKDSRGAIDALTRGFETTAGIQENWGRERAPDALALADAQHALLEKMLVGTDSGADDVASAGTPGSDRESKNPADVRTALTRAPRTALPSTATAEEKQAHALSALTEHALMLGRLEGFRATGQLPGAPDAEGLPVVTSLTAFRPLGIGTLAMPEQDDAAFDARALEQGVLPDCYVLAPAAALGHTRPEALAKKVKTNGQHAEVALPGREPMKVDGRVYVDVRDGRPVFSGTRPGVDAGANPSGTRLALLEKALAQSRQHGYSSLEFGDAALAHETLNGQGTGRHTTLRGQAPGTSAALLGQLEMQQLPTTVSTHTDPELYRGTGLATNHTYAFLGMTKPTTAFERPEARLLNLQPAEPRVRRERDPELDLARLRWPEVTRPDLGELPHSGEVRVPAQALPNLLARVEWAEWDEKTGAQPAPPTVL